MKAWNACCTLAARAGMGAYQLTATCSSAPEPDICCSWMDRRAWLSFFRRPSVAMCTAINAMSTVGFSRGLVSSCTSSKCLLAWARCHASAASLSATLVTNSWTSLEASPRTCISYLSRHSNCQSSGRGYSGDSSYNRSCSSTHAPKRCLTGRSCSSSPAGSASRRCGSLPKAIDSNCKRGAGPLLHFASQSLPLFPTRPEPSWDRAAHAVASMRSIGCQLLDSCHA
mmetsp:Transcript_78200/g.253228  ORF Transcript_78200/g.253228 Transcript_78200/m.253228 type:complete len:227 (-) Transcript_78200:44-724(-)